MTIKTFIKGKATSLSTNFKSTEFDCHGSGCCSETLIDEQLVKYLQDIRDHFGKPVKVSSAYRCATHNKNVGGATSSYHMKGQAADIYITEVKPAEIAKYAESIGILGIGLYETDKDGYFVHIDTRATKSFWYGQKEEKRSTFGGQSVQINNTSNPIVPKKELYRIRKSWKDSKSQIGAYSILANAKLKCDNAGEGYYVFNIAGEIVYPIQNDNIIDTKEENTIQSTVQVSNTIANGKMKYNNDMKPIVCMQTQSTCYKNTGTMKIKGVLWHSTGANNTTLKRYVQPSDNAPNKEEMLKLLGINKYHNDWNHIERQAGLNCWIGTLADGTVTTVQTMPWEYRPWGCGSGAKGSCNNGWIQFEICEDDLTNKEYFDKVYEEACQITAYLCDMYDIDPFGTVRMNGVDIPTILCHKDSYDLGFGCNHSDINHWFPKFGKSMESVRKDVAILLNGKNGTPITADNLYTVKKSVNDTKYIIGTYHSLQHAITARNKAGVGYYVFDINGNIVYPEIPKAEDLLAAAAKLTEKQAISLREGTKYSNGESIPAWVTKKKLYIKSILDDGRVIFSTSIAGTAIGIVYATDIIPYVEITSTTIPEKTFEPYLVKITGDVVNVRTGSSTKYRIVTQIRKGQVYTIVEEHNGWGKLKSGVGWISLDYARRI